MKLLSRLKSVAPIILITLAIYLLTHTTIIAPFRLHLTFLMLITLIVYRFYKPSVESPLKPKILLYMIIACILFLVSATGWFFSPFFFTLYLSAIFLSFVFPPAVFSAYIITLTLLFSFNIGEVDLAYDFLVILSLLTTIPLSLFLRKEYLRLKQNEKDILILQKERESYHSKVEELLSNKITSFAANLRQPINDIKQYAYHLEDVKSKKEAATHRDRIIASAEEAIRTVNTFEADATGKNILSNPKKP